MKRFLCEEVSVTKCCICRCGAERAFEPCFMSDSASAMLGKFLSVCCDALLAEGGH